jgi:hypothetical protein
MPRRNAIIILGALAVLVTVALSVATDLATADLPEDWKPSPRLAWSTVIGLTVLLVLVAAGQVVAEGPAAEALLSAVTDRDAFKARKELQLTVWPRLSSMACCNALTL